MGSVWTWVEAAQVISIRPCRLLGLVVTPSGDTASFTIYDGEGSSDPVILTIKLPTKDSTPFNFPGGLQTDRGLYIGTLTAITGVLVHWEVD